MIALLCAAGVVMDADLGVGIIKPVLGDSAIRIPGHTLIYPPGGPQHFHLFQGHGVMVVACVGIAKTVNRRAGIHRGIPCDPLILPPQRR